MYPVRNIGMKKIIRKINNKGYYTVEAAIFIPIFVLCILCIGYMIKVTSAEEEIMHAMTDESRLAMINAYVMKKDPLLPGRIKKRIKKLNNKIEHPVVRNYWFGHSDGKDKGLISFEVKCVLKNKMPIAGMKKFELSNRLMCRGFVGAFAISTPMSFEEMEKTGEENQVWIFPEYGYRYHNKGCTFLRIKFTGVRLDESLKKSLSPCKICRAKDIQNGAVVYYFLEYGMVYHRKSCTALYKNKISIDKYVAEDRGYTPCSKCGG